MAGTQKAFDNGILEEDFTVIAYCPSCQTSLSHAEANQGYEEVKTHHYTTK